MKPDDDDEDDDDDESSNRHRTGAAARYHAAEPGSLLGTTTTPPTVLRQYYAVPARTDAYAREKETETALARYAHARLHVTLKDLKTAFGLRARMEEGVRVQVQGHDGQRCAAVRSLPRQSRAQIAPANGQNLKVQIAPGANSVPGTELDTSLRPSLQLTPSESPSAPGVPSPSLPFFTNRDSDSDSEPRSRAAVMVTRVRIEPQSSSTRRGQ
eukprot:1877513-Rhodomonas_salina.1